MAFFSTSHSGERRDGKLLCVCFFSLIYRMIFKGGKLAQKIDSAQTVKDVWTHTIYLLSSVFKVIRFCMNFGQHLLQLKEYIYIGLVLK